MDEALSKDESAAWAALNSRLPTVSDAPRRLQGCPLTCSNCCPPAEPTRVYRSTSISRAFQHAYDDLSGRVFGDPTASPESTVRLSDYHLLRRDMEAGVDRAISEAFPACFEVCRRRLVPGTGHPRGGQESLAAVIRPDTRAAQPASETPGFWGALWRRGPQAGGQSGSQWTFVMPEPTVELSAPASVMDPVHGGGMSEGLRLAMSSSYVRVDAAVTGGQRKRKRTK
eukprot:TRINITY_DN16798_c0_g1_i2.p1 TRINITY_DN16798_c0_g1~~TRINITY_DN16798_c0_g1_i2.p1  ORF type:complete len:247 (+),score=41.16 TRINITY_DN16798_c0_g1_i2:63-743(+)